MLNIIQIDIGDDDRKLIAYSVQNEQGQEIALFSDRSKAESYVAEHVPANWENCPESFLATVNIRESICPNSGYCYVQ